MRTIDALPVLQGCHVGMFAEKADEMGGGIEVKPFRNLSHAEYRIGQQSFGFRKQFLADVRLGGRSQRLPDDFIQIIGGNAQLVRVIFHLMPHHVFRLAI